MGGRIMASTINADTSNGVIITPDTSGEIELQANGVTKAKVTANGLQDANGNSLRGGSFRNLIINGDMQIAQRGTSATGLTTSDYYTLDRWKFVPNTMGTWTMSQDTDVPSGQGFSSSLKLQCTTADASPAAADYLRIYQKIEAQMLQHLKYGTSSAEKVTFSFWVKSNKTGTYTVRIYAQDNARHIVNTYTIDTADTWEKKTITFNADTTGTINNDNGSGFQCDWWFGTGSSYQGGGSATDWESSTGTKIADGLTVNLADSTSNYINITGVQLEVGEGASDFEFLPYDVQLQRCQRYYYRNSADSNYMSYASGRANSTTVGVFTYNHPVTMRASPTYTQSGTGINTPSQITTTSLGTIYAGKNSSFIVVNVASGLTAGNGLLWVSNNNTTSYVEANAEL